TGAPTYGYTYDALGNIATYTENGTAYTYTYDDLGQLLTAAGGGKAYAYTYDLGGNILTVSDGTTSHTYTYGDSQWADLLTAFDGQSITYDASGNPLSYYNGTRYTFTWAEGRRLVSAVKGNSTYTYAYDSDGLRVSKTVNGVKHEYFYASGKLLRETYGNVTMDFLYNNNGYPYALKYNGTTYYYITNLQGDVLSLINASGSTVASYTYDPYGKVLTATGTMAQTNPLRYRGYYYDSETGFYYLQSRYYDPTICRFINADAFASTGQGVLGYNMFAYCINCPIRYVDNDGDEPGDLFNSIDDAAEDAAIYIGGYSFAEGVEYSASIYEVKTEHELFSITFTKKYTGDNAFRSKLADIFFGGKSVKTISCSLTITQYSYGHIQTDYNPVQVIPYLDKNTVAIVHTHPMGSGEGVTRFSPQDCMFSQNYKVLLYVYGPNGELHRLDPTQQDLTKAETIVSTTLPKHLG
ncbi:MAG: RHS repeat-associated core domain-containing protein, partial [Faecousia sp.]